MVWAALRGRWARPGHSGDAERATGRLGACRPSEPDPSLTCCARADAQSEQSLLEHVRVDRLHRAARPDLHARYGPVRGARPPWPSPPTLAARPIPSEHPAPLPYSTLRRPPRARGSRPAELGRHSRRAWRRRRPCPAGRGRSAAPGVRVHVKGWGWVRGLGSLVRGQGDGLLSTHSTISGRPPDCCEAEYLVQRAEGGSEGAWWCRGCRGQACTHSLATRLTMSSRAVGSGASPHEEDHSGSAKAEGSA